MFLNFSAMFWISPVSQFGSSFVRNFKVNPRRYGLERPTSTVQALPSALNPACTHRHRHSIPRISLRTKYLAQSPSAETSQVFRGCLQARSLSCVPEPPHSCFSSLKTTFFPAAPGDTICQKLQPAVFFCCQPKSCNTNMSCGKFAAKLEQCQTNSENFRHTVLSHIKFPLSHGPWYKHVRRTAAKHSRSSSEPAPPAETKNAISSAFMFKSKFSHNFSQVWEFQHEHQKGKKQNVPTFLLLRLRWYVYVFMYMYLCISDICIYVYMIYVFMFMNLCIYVYVFMYVYLCICIYVLIYVLMSMYLCISLYIYMYIYMYTYMYLCVMIVDAETHQTSQHQIRNSDPKKPKISWVILPLGSSTNRVAPWPPQIRLGLTLL